MDHIDIVEIKAALKGCIELAPAQAAAVRAYFDSLKAEGFNDEQALRIIMKHGYCAPSPGNNGYKETEG